MGTCGCVRCLSSIIVRQIPLIYRDRAAIRAWTTTLGYRSFSIRHPSMATMNLSEYQKSQQHRKFIDPEPVSQLHEYLVAFHVHSSQAMKQLLQRQAQLRSTNSEETYMSYSTISITRSCLGYVARVLRIDKKADSGNPLQTQHREADMQIVRRGRWTHY